MKLVSLIFGVLKFEHLENNTTNQNCIQEEGKRGLNSGNY
jgi:hypothetical protein